MSFGPLRDDMTSAPDLNLVPALTVYHRIRGWLALADDAAATQTDRAVARKKALELIAQVLGANRSMPV